MLLGCNVPKLMAIIIQELKLEEQYKAGEYERVFYEFDQLLPDEQEREVMKMQIEEEINRIEMEQAIEQRKEYIRFVTDEISQHIIDMGIMLFFPHVMKEAYRKTADIADKMELACKDRKIIKIKPEMMEILHYEVDNPLDDELLEYVFTKEVLIFLWKLGETDTRAPEEVLKVFYRAIAEPSELI
jgi:thioredoxin domain-containing protein 3